MTTNNTDELLTPAEVIEILKIDLNTLYIWLRAGKLPGIKVGDLWRVRRSDLENFLNANAKET